MSNTEKIIDKVQKYVSKCAELKIKIMCINERKKLYKLINDALHTELQIHLKTHNNTDIYEEHPAIYTILKDNVFQSACDSFTSSITSRINKISEQAEQEESTRVELTQLYCKFIKKLRHLNYESSSIFTTESGDCESFKYNCSLDENFNCENVQTYQLTENLKNFEFELYKQIIELNVYETHDLEQTYIDYLKRQIQRIDKVLTYFSENIAKLNQKIDFL